MQISKREWKKGITREEYNKYMREYHIKRYHAIRQRAIKLLGGKCIKCGSKEKLQFDHVDKNGKKFNVSMWLSKTLGDFWEEIKKCQLLCQKCHIEKTVLERGQKLARGTHGTLSAYRYCKCDLCKKAHQEHYEAYSKNHKRIWRNGKRITVPL